ncbi:MAG: hypothetical protein OEY86_05075 [Nitrospira sp.]|nr:hypothetical protein [Nitrospira sp.]
MDRPIPDAPQKHDQLPHAPSRLTERAVILAMIGLVLLSALWALREDIPSGAPVRTPGPVSETALSPEMVPLTTGEEPIPDIFIRAGCPVCHVIPGIPGANGRVGPALVLGTTGAQRLSNPTYSGSAKTVHGYIIESVLEPERFIVPGYPSQTMPLWYGTKLSALALEKIAAYLEKQTGVDGD